MNWVLTLFMVFFLLDGERDNLLLSYFCCFDFFAEELIVELQ